MLIEDHAVAEQFDDPVAGGVDVPRVHRQQQDRDELRDDVGDLIGASELTSRFR